MQNDILSIIEAHTGGEGDMPPGLGEFAARSREAAQIARQHAGGWQGHGGTQLRERIMRVANLSGSEGGDIVHVGHGNGNVTAALAAVAQKHGCRIVAINTGVSDEEMRVFNETMMPYREATLGPETKKRLLITAGKNEPETATLLKERFHWRFAFISDKDNSFRSYLDDIMVFTSCPVVAVDYCFHPDGTRLAFEVAAVLLGRVTVRDAHCREGYLVMP
jgi:hypothetical protein